MSSPKLFLCLLLTTAFTRPSLSQSTFTVPNPVVLEKKEDYANYEKDIIAAAKWLEETDLDKETDKRLATNTFVLQWLTGSPTVSVALDDTHLKLYGDNPQLLAIFLASYARNILENPGSKDIFQATRAGIISMMNVYKKGIDVKKVKDLDKFIKAYDAGTGDEWIRSKFKF